MIRYFYILAFLFLSATSVLQAQTKSIDSLTNLLKNESEDSSRSMTLARLSRHYLYFKTDTALLLAQQGLIIARKIHFARGEARCLNSLANALSQLGNDLKALELYHEALKISENINDYTNVAVVLGNIGLTYDTQKDYKKALEFYQKANTIATRIGAKKTLTTNFINIGSTYEKLNQLDSARFYINKAYEIVINDSNPELLGGILISFGNIYAKMQQPEIAMANYKQGLLYSSEANYNEGVCETSLGLAKLLKKQNQNDSSLFYARLSLNTAEKNGFIQWILNSSFFLAEYYKQVNSNDSAYKYLSLMTTAKDSLFNQEKNRQIEILSINETLRQQEIAAAKKEQEKEHSDNMQYAFMAIGLATFIIIFLLLTHSIIINEKWIRFLGVLGLLLLFEFFNLLLHPYISKITHHSPLLMLIVLVAIAALLIPQHHRIEKWVIQKMVSKNRNLRLNIAKKTVTLPEEDANDTEKL